MSDPFVSIETLKATWDGLQPLAAEHERRLWQKFRLEWNYHSNYIEGNTLTYGETVLLLLHGQTHGTHALREYEEMKAHDAGIAHLRNLAADAARLIGPGDIRDLNRIILKEPFWKPTQTPDGRPTRVEVIPGEYKSMPNSVITATGELFEYASPVEVPARMQALVDWLAGALEGGNLHVLEIAAKLHHDFVLIHPFGDGNGRVARMLVNYLLLRGGYPPVIVPSEQKSAYLAALRLADAGDLGPLTAFLGEQLERSLNLAIRAGKGENIEEPSDVEKQVALFVRSEQAHRKESEELLDFLAETSFLPFIRELERKLESLKPVFSRFTVQTTRDGAGNTFRKLNLIPSKKWIEFPNRKFKMIFSFGGYKGAATHPFNHETRVAINFPPESYTITHDKEVILSKPYPEPILDQEIDEITARILSKTFGVIQSKAGPKET